MDSSCLPMPTCKFTLEGIQHGFRNGFNNHFKCSSEEQNLSSAKFHLHIISNYLAAVVVKRLNAWPSTSYMIAGLSDNRYMYLTYHHLAIMLWSESKKKESCHGRTSSVHVYCTSSWPIKKRLKFWPFQHESKRQPSRYSPWKYSGNLSMSRHCACRVHVGWYNTAGTHHSSQLYGKHLQC